ncbi:FtsQ-type POTRA domain-containing protein [Planococcus maritimus]|uniref:Cell division protein DivIB n=1 Tax=Planococcus rifietoensis TaxID=200991 RepID=A0A0U2YQA0_9BACL|nr:MULTISPECIES: FtsQ-type POTRA domain-containing protein [Planococcus]ALS76810.1 division initiation protein [Planococcus rifietoensis]MDE4086301.1 FtsQ-type POTRA domain-containing protein [Planococcus maritimus]
MDKVIDIEERIPTLRERRRKRSNRKFAALLTVFISLLFILLYSQSTYSEIRDIKVTGAELFDGESYKQASTLALGDSMWSFDSGEIEREIESLEWVESATVKKNWLSSVEIEIQEFVEMGYLDQGNSYQVVLSNGVVLNQPISVVEGPIFSNFEDEAKREALIEQLVKTDPEVQNLISQVILDTEQERADYITIYMNDGNEIKAILSTLAEKINYYPSVTAQLEGRQGIIDMEVGIYFRSYNDVFGLAEAGEELENIEEQ